MKDPTRRSFLKQSLVGAGLLSCHWPVVVQAGHDAGRRDELFARFAAPPAEARPFFRWWWNGNRVTPGEIRRELALMHAAGAGGVEINPIALHETVRDPSGVPLDWLGDAWNACVRAAVAACRERGMIVDLIVGTGWPFGGQLLAPEETIQGLVLEVRPFEGPGPHHETVPLGDGATERLVQLTLYPQPLPDLASGIDLLPRVQPDGTVAFDVPEGAHALYILTWRGRFREVMFGAPGGDGPVLDHFNRQAVEKYLHRISDRLGPVLGGQLGDGLRALFCDSIELEGANWTSDFAAAFERRRGYRIDAYLPLVLHDGVEAAPEAADALRRMRYDFSRTLAELFMERFIEPFHAWCHANGTLSRYQAYGYPWLYTDLLDGYLVPDIPEGDQWLFNAGWIRTAVLDDIRYAIWNKYASSAGHLAGRRIVSTEAMTNTRGVFRATLAYLKQATDINLVTGINHLVLHGFNYSPHEAGFPGWIRFGTYFNEQNPWWPYLRHWMDYAGRLCAAFQAAEPVAHVALLGPTPDVWSDHGLERNAWNLTPWYLHALWQAFNHHGHTADYVNATVLEEAASEGGALRYGPMQYRLLVLAGVETLPPATAEAVARYAEQGGRVVFAGAVPHRSPGWLDREANDWRVQAAMVQARAAASAQVVEAPPEGALVSWAGRLLRAAGPAPDVDLSNPDPKLYFTRARRGARDLYFFVNMDRTRTIEGEARFPTGDKTPWRWDPETGTRTVFPYGRTKDRLDLSLPPLASLLLVFEPEHAPPASPEPTPDLAAEIVLAGPWQVVLQPIEGGGATRTLHALTDLAQVPGLDAFSGLAVYETSFAVEVPGGAYELDLGAVHEVAEVTLNGAPLGVRWWGARRYRIPEGLLRQENRLAVRVATLPYNYARSLAQHPHARYWVEQSGLDAPLPAGLLGPVRLYPVR